MTTILRSKVFDRIFRMMILVPMVCYWRGIWDLYTYYFSILPEPLNYWAMVAIGSLFILAYFVYPLVHRGLKRHDSFTKTIITRLTLFLGGIFNMGYWRGVWAVAEYYLGGFGWQGSMLVFAFNYAVLTLLTTSRTLIFPPFVISVDNRPDALVPSTLFQVKAQKNLKSCLLYVLDVLFTHFIVIPLVIVTWRSGMACIENLQRPSLARNIDYYILGMILCIVIFALGRPLCNMASNLTSASFMSVYFENCTGTLFDLVNVDSDGACNNFERNETLNDKSYFDFICSKETTENNDIENQLLTKLTLENNLYQEKSLKEDISETQKLRNEVNNSLQKTLKNQQLVQKNLPQTFTNSNHQQLSQQKQENLSQITPSTNPLIFQESSEHLKLSEKIIILVFEDIIGLFALISLMFAWLGAWEVNIAIFNVSDAIDAWINFIIGSITLFLFGLVSFGGFCGCAHDFPRVFFPPTSSPSTPSLPKAVSKDLGAALRPVQLGVGVPGGCEAAILASRHFVETSSRNNIIVKLDMSNAFNSLRRDHLLEVSLRRAPSLFPLANIASGHFIQSRTRVQQGDPLGSLLFTLAVDDIAQSALSPLNIWYLDDATLGSPPEVVAKDLLSIILELNKIGLAINPSKSEIIDIFNDDFNSVFVRIQEVLTNCQVTPLNNLNVLGAPINQEAIQTSLLQKRDLLISLLDKLTHLDRHPALFLLKNCLAIPKLLYTLRCSPCFLQDSLLEELGQIIRCSTEKICNVQLDETSWSQASLPVRHGGIGVRNTVDVARPAYFSSLASSWPLVNEILIKTNGSINPTQLADSYSSFKDNRPTNICIQRQWDDISCKQVTEKLLTCFDQHKTACLRSAMEPHIGDWLNALPLPQTGTYLDDDTVQIGVSLRLVLRLCESHSCRCGKTIDVKGIHPLSSQKSAGRFPSHSALNDIIRRGMEAAGCPAILEPVGIDRGDGKRPDGISVFPFTDGKLLTGDATCSDSFSEWNIISTAVEPGSAARAAESLKLKKYSSLLDRFIFIPVAVETSGVIGPKGLAFLRLIGKKSTRMSGDSREKRWLLERISMAIVRSNCLSILSAGLGHQQSFQCRNTKS